MIDKRTLNEGVALVVVAHVQLKVSQLADEQSITDFSGPPPVSSKIGETKTEPLPGGASTTTFTPGGASSKPSSAISDTLWLRADKAPLGDAPNRAGRP